MRKNYVLDTNVLLQDAEAIKKFEDNRVYLPVTVIDELDSLKTSLNGETAYNARRANRALKELMKEKSLASPIPLPKGGKLIVVTQMESADVLPEGLDPSKNDHKILLTAAYIRKKNQKAPTILVTKDVSMQFKAGLMNLEVQDYKNQQLDCSYTGRAELFLPAKCIDRIYLEKVLPLSEALREGEKEVAFVKNEYFLLKALENPQKQALAVFNGNEFDLLPKKLPSDEPKFSPLSTNIQSPLKCIRPLNIGQNFALHALNAGIEQIPLAILSGAAGSAKTFLSLAVGLDWVLKGKVRQVLLLRPQSYFDSEIGFLPGDEQSKIDPLLRPAYDNLAEILELSGVPVSQIQQEMLSLFEKGLIRAESFTYIRGRSITNSFIVLDEAQNATRHQTQGAVTRIGSGSKLVMCGDAEQVDNPRLDIHNNGIVFAMNMMKGSPLCSQVAFTKKECNRSPLAEDALKRMF